MSKSKHKSEKLVSSKLTHTYSNMVCSHFTRLSQNAICLMCGYTARVNYSRFEDGHKNSCHCPHCRIKLTLIGQNIRVPKNEKSRSF